MKKGPGIILQGGFFFFLLVCLLGSRKKISLSFSAVAAEGWPTLISSDTYEKPGLFVETRGRNYSVLLKISLFAQVYQSSLKHFFYVPPEKKTPKNPKHMRGYN